MALTIVNDPPEVLELQQPVNLMNDLDEKVIELINGLDKLCKKENIKFDFTKIMIKRQELFIMIEESISCIANSEQALNRD